MSKPDREPEQIPLRAVGEGVVRRCRKCGGNMKPLARDDERWNGPGAERGIRFACTDCKTQVSISDVSSLLAILLGGAGGFAIVIYALVNDVMGFITHALFTQSTPASIAIALGLSVVLLVFFLGSLQLMTLGGQKIYDRSSYRLLDKGETSLQAGLIFFLGFLPFPIIIGVSMLNFYHLDMDSVALASVVPALALPFLIGHKIGVNWMSVFMATLFWFGLAVIGFFIFR